VLPTVDFDNKFGAMTREVDYVGTDANLPAEMSPFLRQPMPEM
jgi:hypothetical protein